MIKRSAGIWFCFLFAITALFFVLSGERVSADETGTVIASLLNVRTGAGTSYDRLEHNGNVVQLENGTAVTILSESDGWYKVSFSYDGETLQGYVSGAYIAIDTPNPTATPTPTTAVTYRNVVTYKKIQEPAVMKKKSTIYKNADTTKALSSAKKDVVLKKKTKVTVVGEKTVNNKKWFKISFSLNKKTKKGFVRASRVRMTLKKKAYAEMISAIAIRKEAGNAASYVKQNKKKVKAEKGAAVYVIRDKMADGVKWYRITWTEDKKDVKGYVKAKYVRLAKKKTVKKEAVTVLSDKEFEKMLTSEGFPESYKASLRTLHKAYPYWQFKAFQTGVDWNSAWEAESEIGVNLISNSKSKAWKSTEKGAYDASTGKWTVFDGSTWVAASKEAVAYYMDPRNFLNERNIFQFELLEYQSQYQTKDGVNSIIKNTPFYKKDFTWADLTTGEKKTMKYATAFIKAAKESGVSPYHLASRVKQEVVTSATTTSIAVTGTNTSYPGIYNFYNIGATSGTNPAVKGLKWASKGTTYLRPWTDPYRSIVGGGCYIGSSYISKGQNTGYLQKFNVTENQRYAHQYMTNVEAAYSEAIKTKQAYADTMDKTPIVFSIPVYQNMPEEKCAAPQ